MTSEERNGEEQSMSSQVASLASPTPMQESDWARRTSAIYGPRCFALYERSGLATSWGRTLLGCLLGTAEWSSKRCYLIWKQKVTGPRRRLSFQLLVKALPIEGIGSGLSRTPTTAMLNADRAKDPEYANRKIAKSQTITLADQAKMGLLQTPVADDSVARVTGKVNSRGEPKLSGQAAMGLLPTPMAQDERRATEEQTLRRKEAYGGTKRAMYLNNYLSLGMLPTPNSAKASNDATLAKSGDGRSKPNKLGWALAEGMLPTPAASNPNDGESPETWHERAAMLKERHGNGNGAGTPLSIAVQDATGRTGLLNHRYVMEMMGLPPDWCDIPPERLKRFVSKRSTQGATPSSRKSPSRSSKQ